MPDEAALVLGLVRAGWTLEDVALLQALAQPLPEVAVCQVAQQHIAPAEVALAQRAALTLSLRRLMLSQHRVVEAAGPAAGALVQNADHDVVLDAVVPHLQLRVLALEVAVGTFEGRHLKEEKNTVYFMPRISCEDKVKNNLNRPCNCRMVERDRKHE